MVLTNYEHDPLLDLDPWVGQRSCTYRFVLSNRVTGELLGDVTPIKTANLSHDTGRTIKRRLTLTLGVQDMEWVDPLTDIVSVYMVFPNDVSYALGTYMFTDSSRQVFTSGRIGELVLNDLMFLVDQQIDTGINGVGMGVGTVIGTVLTDLDVTWIAEPSPYTSAEAWGIGVTRGSILESLSLSGDYFSPWFDHENVLRFIRSFNPAEQIPDLDLDAGNQVLRSQIIENDNLLTAPNKFIVVSNNSSNSNIPVAATAVVPANAPNSIPNRGFAITETVDLQLSDNGQAAAVANGLVNRQTLYEQVMLATAPDPRYDSYTVVHWRGDLWLDLSWSLDLIEGASMSHLFRRGYSG